MLATHVSLTLVRFDTVQVAGEWAGPPPAGTLFRAIGADGRAASTPVSERSGYTFAIFGLHDSLDSAAEMHQRHAEICPWTQSAKETFSLVLLPTRHIGEVNYLAPENPGLIYNCSAEGVPPGRFVVLITVGFDRIEGWQKAAAAFGEGVSAVRMSMSSTAGLLSQQTFFLDGGEFDGLTVTIWNSFAEMRDAMYGPGVHRDMLQRHRDGGFGNPRSSFARCSVERSSGTWEGGHSFESL
ncbi:MAG: hypothetical protein JNJ45_05025 [Chthonomonas sp.]|nr:hypothetical protein [Chthonomonas sp.]